MTMKERESLYEIVSVRLTVCLSIDPFVGPSVSKYTSASLHFHSGCMSARNRQIAISCVHANLCHSICLKTLAVGSWRLAGGSWSLARGMDVRTYAQNTPLYRAPPFWATAQKGLAMGSPPFDVKFHLASGSFSFQIYSRISIRGGASNGDHLIFTVFFFVFTTLWTQINCRFLFLNP